MSIAGKSLSIYVVGTVLVELFHLVSTGSLRFFLPPQNVCDKWGVAKVAD